MNLKKLKEAFNPNDIEWRIQQAKMYKGKPTAVVLAYLTNRAIMDRLDDVCGPENWRNEYTKGPDGGIVCGISIKIGTEWVTKYDGAENTKIESVKGGLSDAMKRAAVQWGIGRYLYKLPKTYAIFTESGNYNVKINVSGQDSWFKWSAPDLPGWAIPSVEEKKTISDPNYPAQQNLEEF